MMYNPRYWDGLPTPLYPFGFGLSYTTFSITNLKVAAPQACTGACGPGVKVGSSVAVTADVTNTGPVVGDEVVQLYIHQKAGSDSRPMRELKGFQRLTLQSSETKTVAFQLGPAELGYWSTNAGKWVQDSEAFDIWVGADSLATLHADLEVVR
jgi:beta-glucosidase